MSAWFYRGHNPNLDFFQVRPEFKNVHLELAKPVNIILFLYFIIYNLF